MAKTPLAGALTLVAAMAATAAMAGGSEVAAAVPGPNDYGTASRIAVTYGHAGMTPMFDTEWIWSSAVPDAWYHRTAGNATGTCAVLHLPTGALVEGVTTFTNDSDALPFAGVDYVLQEIDMHTDAVTDHFVFQAVGVPGIERTFRPIPVPFTIRNERLYTLCIYHGTWGPRCKAAGRPSGTGSRSARRRRRRAGRWPCSCRLPWAYTSRTDGLNAVGHQ